MSRQLSILCAGLLIAPACDDPETSDERRPAADPAADPDADTNDDEPPAPAPPRQAMIDELVDLGEVAAAGNCATMFEHVNFGGSRLEINTGTFTWIGGPWNDQVSSMKVRSGCVLNAYEHVNFAGDQKSFLGSVNWVGDGWNDKISSFKCSC